MYLYVRVNQCFSISVAYIPSGIQFGWFLLLYSLISAIWSSVVAGTVTLANSTSLSRLELAVTALNIRKLKIRTVIIFMGLFCLSV